MIFPKATISEIIGLLEAVNDSGGIEDVARLAADFDLEIDEILPSIDGAELLGLAVVREGNIELTTDARKLLDAGIRDRKKIIKDKVASVDMIRELIDRLRSEEEYKISKEEALRFIQKKISTMDIDSYFRIIINWTRYAGLIGYNSDSEEICLLQKER
ncbi:MAG: AAA-associated domain-containing protein [Candidatus Methanoperedens sp.]|nr:AAA-associated domain-containing protein [Candidatus Methanoperedens sp.]MCE8427517.1 AAA-associated domain-containing protein [Candidatus Methanoperedens sp.]